MNVYTMIYIEKTADDSDLPDNATRSVVSRLTAENLDVMLARLSNGLGIELLAPAWFAVRPSLLPSSTFHEGPPDYKLLT